MNTFFLLFLSALLNGIAQLAWKYGLNIGGAETFREKMLALLVNIPFLAGFLLYGLSIIIWIVVLSRVEVSYAYPLLSLSYIVVVIGGYFLGETISFERMIGIFCIMLGIFFIARS